MTEEEVRIENDAVEYVKAHKKEILSRFCPSTICHSVSNPVSLFMAGSAGAGKTEVSKGLIKKFNDVPIRIDADEIRTMCPGYVGSNAHLFQKAATKGVHMLFDHALDHDINCILDGTFAYGGAAENIQRSIRHNRRVELWFVYQDPIRAWEFTKAREVREARRVSKDLFIKAFLNSRYNARAVKEQFGKDIELNILVKDYETGEEDLRLNVPADELDRITDGRYSLENLNHLLV